MFAARSAAFIKGFEDMTTHKDNGQLTASERRDALVELHLAEDGNGWDYGQWIVAILENAFGRVESVLGPDASATPLLSLVAEAARIEGENPNTWREALETVSPSSWIIWPMARRLEDALLYGLYGVAPSDIPLDERDQWIAELMAWLEDFAGKVDGPSIAGADNQVDRVARIARSRNALETGVGDVDLGSLATFGGISEGRVRNLMSGAEPTLVRGEDGIKAASALAWLRGKKEFFPSIWDRPDAADENIDEPSLEADQVIFVPVSRDGSMFHSGLRRNGTFTIGAKGAERQFEKFEDALGALHCMPTPRWRRPNEAGFWSIVTGTTWQRVERQSLPACA